MREETYHGFADVAERDDCRLADRHVFIFSLAHKRGDKGGPLVSRDFYGGNFTNCLCKE